MQNKLRDYQRQAVYNWENRVVALPVARAIVAYVWAREGLKNPPKVSELPRQCSVKAGDGRREEVRFPSETKTWIVLHELAHAMAPSDLHGPVYVGIYIQLLSRYMNMSVSELAQSAEKAGVEFDLLAKPEFL